MSTPSRGIYDLSRARRISDAVAYYGVLVPPRSFITEIEVKLYLAKQLFGWGMRRAEEHFGFQKNISTAALSMVENARIMNTAFDRWMTKLESSVTLRRNLGVTQNANAKAQKAA